jgi:hypothetical protein
MAAVAPACTQHYSIGDKKRDFVNKNRRFSLFFRRAYQ